MCKVPPTIRFHETDHFHGLRLHKIDLFHGIWSQQEIDLIEERDGRLFTYEFKWGKKSPLPPRVWTEHYPDATFKVIDRENYLDFVTGKR